MLQKGKKSSTVSSVIMQKWFRNMRQKILEILKKIIPEQIEIEVFVPEDEKFGHYSTNIAFKLAKLRKKTPFEVAKEIYSKFQVLDSKFFSKIEIAPPGFINFWISRVALQTELKQVLKLGGRYGQGKSKKQRVSFDYLDANPTGPVHIGHARSGFLGDVLGNVLRFAGYKVSKEFYVNDAKSSAQIKSLGRTALGKGKEYKHKQLLEFLKKPAVKAKLKKIKGEAEAGFYVAGLIQKQNEKFLKSKANLCFDLFFEEQSVYKSGLINKILSALEKTKAVYKKDGALWLRSSRYGDDKDRVLIRKTGEPTYALPDTAYHWDRLVRRKFDRAVNIFGADHYGYGPRLKAALAALDIKPEKIHIIAMQMVRFVKGGKEVKMSKRKGQFITLRELINEVGLDAARFFFLMVSPDTHMDFDLELAKEKSLKNPVYYVQYAYVRAKNIIKKAKLKITDNRMRLDLLDTPEDAKLIRELVRLGEVIEDTARDYQAHRLIRYALELARAFHNFYEKERVIGEGPDLASARLYLVKATAVIFENLFKILGISAPKKM